MKIRKVKKAIKKLDDDKAISRGLSSLRLLIKWTKIDHSNSKSNMKILTGNIYRNGRLDP